MVCGDRPLGSKPQSLHFTARAIALRGTGERNRGCALLVTANKPETAPYRAPTFSLLLASHGGLVCVQDVARILLPGYVFHGTGERDRGYALLVTANKPETAPYRAPTFSLLLASHGGLVCVQDVARILLPGYLFHGTGERDRGYALLMITNEPEAVLNRTPTLSSCVVRWSYRR